MDVQRIMGELEADQRFKQLSSFLTDEERSSVMELARHFAGMALGSYSKALSSMANTSITDDEMERIIKDSTGEHA